MKIAEEEFNRNFKLLFEQFELTKDLLHGKHLMIRECLEFLKQAATNPNFDNDYELDFRDEPAVKDK